MSGNEFLGDLDKALAGGVVFEAAALSIFGTERTIQGHPPNSAGDILRAAQKFSVDQYARADAGADGEKDCVPASFRDSEPGFTQDAAGAVAIDDDAHGAA